MTSEQIFGYKRVINDLRDSNKTLRDINASLVSRSNDAEAENRRLVDWLLFIKDAATEESVKFAISKALQGQPSPYPKWQA